MGLVCCFSFHILDTKTKRPRVLEMEAELTVSYRWKHLEVTVDVVLNKAVLNYCLTLRLGELKL